MSTRALRQLDRRLEDVDRLLEAHRSLSQIRQLRSASAGQTDIVRALGIAQRAFGGPLSGRRWGMEPLNRAGIVLLTAQLERYVEDLFEESAKVIASAAFDINHYNPDAFVNQSIGAFNNPKPENVRKLFSLLGLSDVLSSVQWGTFSEADVRKRLGDLADLRNKIAHGEQPGVTRAKLSQEVAFVRRLARSLDNRLYKYTLNIVGVPLW